MSKRRRIKIIKLFFKYLCIIFIFFAITGCSSEKNQNVQKINIYETENYYGKKENTLVVIENKEIINFFVKVINNAKWVQGLVGRGKDPDYIIEIGKDSYLFWTDDIKAVMAKEEDNGTIFSLSNSSTKKVNEIIRQYLNPLN
ncbi:hypothetical protein F7731_18360 [Cytobacillus depressus]|uniref:YhfM-like domain-containing protein n=1 Tax=Cytobacillus depressus TaxID=1602942 RepID=A0A6L3V1D0_9BACI|nr:hypothetical protein [Cytobacillus depressus]KAB2331549.1 hypothetical protein F7731_18360 [Cytobacillus depressus]